MCVSQCVCVGHGWLYVIQVSQSDCLYGFSPSRTHLCKTSLLVPISSAGHFEEFNSHDDSFTQFLTNGYFYCTAFLSFSFGSLLCSIPAYLSPQEYTLPAAAANLHLQGLFSLAHVTHFTKVHVLMSVGSLLTASSSWIRGRVSQLENTGPKPRGVRQPCH